MLGQQMAGVSSESRAPRAEAQQIRAQGRNGRGTKPAAERSATRSAPRGDTACHLAGLPAIERRCLLLDTRCLLMRARFATEQPRALGLAVSGLGTCSLTSQASVRARSCRALHRTSRQLAQRRHVTRAVKHRPIVNGRPTGAHPPFLRIGDTAQPEFVGQLWVKSRVVVV